MNSSHFDALTRALIASPAPQPTRRSLVASLAGGALAVGGLGAAESLAKRKKKKKGKKGKKGKGHGHGHGHGHGGGGGGGTVPSGPVFSVSGRSILTPQGNPKLLRGVNKMSVFDQDVPMAAATSRRSPSQGRTRCALSGPSTRTWDPRMKVNWIP